MGTETRKLEAGKKSDCWHVRNEQGEKFGPVGLETLKAWACDGRLGPTNEVSETGAAWQLATSLRALEMDWVAEVTSGTFYGPIHRRAMEELVKDNSISAQSAFFFRRGLVERAEPLADGGQTEAIRRLSDQVAQALQRAAAGDAQLQQLREQLAAQVEQARQQAALQAEEVQRESALQKQLREQLAAQVEQARQQAALQAEEAQRESALQKQLREQLAAQLEQAQQQAALEQQQRQQAVSQAEEAQRQIAAHEERARAAQQQMAALVAQVEQAQRQVAACEEQVRSAQQQATASAAQVEQALQQAASEQQMRLQAVSQAEEAQRQIASHEERVRVAQQQSAASAAQAEQARQLASAAEARLCGLAQQISEQAEQARVLQLQWNAKSDAFAQELQLLRTEQSEALAAVAKVRSERDAQALALETQVRAFDAERQELQAALGHAKAELSIREVRFAQVEQALAGSEGADAARGALESQVRALSAELIGLHQALAEEKVSLGKAEARCTTLEAALAGSEGADAARAALEGQVGALNAELIGLHQALAGEKIALEKAESRCTTLEAALEEARSRCGRETSLADVGAELRQVRLQLEALCVHCRQASGARDVSQERRAEERVVSETVEVEVLPPEDRPKAAPKAREAERVAPEWRRGQAEAPAGTSAGRAASGLSMADLEQQARRELERLGAQGVNLFKKKR